MKNIGGYFVPLALAVVLAGGVWWQARANEVLRGEQARLRAAAAESARIKAAAALATHPAEDELRKLTEAAAEASRLHEHIAQLRQEESKATAAAAKPKPVERWKNLGLATPSDTVQSVIWAATGGEVDALAAMLAFDPESRTAADAFYASIPASSRNLFPSADALMATAVSSRLPANLKKAELVDTANETADLVRATFKLERQSKSNEEPRVVTFRFQRFGEDWKLLVPKSVVREFQASMQAP